jgi:hypothetical protein
VTDKSGAAGRAVGTPVFGGNALPFPLRLLLLHLRDPRIMEWLHHLPEGVNLSTKLSDEALELWHCIWGGQVTLDGMASIRFSDVLHLSAPWLCERLRRSRQNEWCWRTVPRLVAAPIQAVSCTHAHRSRFHAATFSGESCLPL